MSADVLPSPSTASSSTSIPTQLWAHCRAASGSLRGRAMPGTPLSLAPFLSSSGHPMCARQLGARSHALPLGPIRCWVGSGPSDGDTASHRDRLRGSHPSKTNGASDCPAMVSPASSWCCLLGRGAGSLSALVVVASWTGALGGALPSPALHHPQHNRPSARAPARPGLAWARRLLPPAARSPGWGGRAVPATGAGAPRAPASHGERWPGVAAAAAGGGPGGAAPLALPARGQESPAQARRGGCPCPAALGARLAQPRSCPRGVPAPRPRGSCPGMAAAGGRERPRRPLLGRGAPAEAPPGEPAGPGPSPGLWATSWMVPSRER